MLVTAKKFGKYFVKYDKENGSSSPKNRDFSWIFFFFTNWVNGFIVLLNNNNKCNIVLGHDDLKLDCLYYCCCYLISVYRLLIIYHFVLFWIVYFFFLGIKFYNGGTLLLCSCLIEFQRCLTHFLTGDPKKRRFGLK